MQKKIFSFLFLFLLSSCGYEATYSKKNLLNYDFSISEINFTGDREVNVKMKERLNNYIINKKNKNFKVDILSIATKAVSAKNISGDATSFKSTVSIKVDLVMDNKLKNNFVISESFNYNNNSNRFKLKTYEKNIKNNLTETITEKLIFRLLDIK
jgi:folate-binding Fe-S cluster repair protein YgfZ